MWTHRHDSRVIAEAHPTARPLAAAIALALALATGLALVGALLLGAVTAQAGEDRLDLPQGSWDAPVEAESLRIVINVPARRLFLVQGNTLIASYPVAVGRRSSPTPRGTFRILQKAKDPTWAPKGRPSVPPGPRNPLGPRWMRISPDGYGIHGTNDPASIGGLRSHGCIRLSVPDAIALFDQAPLGTRVDIVYRLDGYDDAGNPVHFADCYGLGAAEGTAF